MKNNKVLYGVICAILLVVVNLVVFISLQNYTEARWVNIVGLNLSIIILLVASIITGNKETHFMKYSKFPIIISYFIITFIVSAILIIVNLESVTVSVVVQVILLALFAIAMSVNKMADNVSEESMKRDNNQKQDVKKLAKKLQMAMERVDDRDVYRKIESAYDAINNAKINITGNSSVIDEEIFNSIVKIEDLIASQNMNDIENETIRIKQLVTKRNEL